MTIKQLSIFIENKGGMLITVLDLLSKAGIQIIASTVADTNDYGIYRVLCDNPLKAYSVLKESGVNSQLTDVIALTINDTPGMAADAIRKISEAKVDILYMYSFLWKGKGVLVFRTNNNDLANETIILNKMKTFSEEDFK